MELRQQVGCFVSLLWTPSHLQVVGNKGTDRMAELGTEQHPNDKRRRVPALWESVGSEPMQSGSDSSSSLGGREISSAPEVFSGSLDSADVSEESSGEGPW